MTDETEVSGAAAKAQSLDPFSYFPGVASKIAGLGGSEQRPDLAYGFHTHYVPAAPGRRAFKIIFEGLRASTGQIHLRVHLLSTKPSAQAHVATAERIDFTTLLKQDGIAVLRFESLPETLYAVYGMVLGTTDAAASGLRVELDRSAGGADADLDPTNFSPEPSHFRSDDVTRAELIQADVPPTLKATTSQVFTRRQTAEPVFGAWSAALEPVREQAKETWEQVFILQTLYQFGFLDGGATGGGYDAAGERLSAVLGRRQCQLASLADLPPGDHRRDGRPHHLPLDFLWSRHVLEGLGSEDAAKAFLVETLELLRPNGLAIHITDALLDVPAAAPDASFHLSRAQIERATVDLLSRGHSVAQLRFALGTRSRDGRHDLSAVVPFGWVIRRGR